MAKKPLIIATYAKNHPHYYSSDEDELRAFYGENRQQRGAGIGTFDPEDPVMYWWPSSRDFKEEATRAGFPVAVANFSEVIAAIRRYKDLHEVHFYGHGASGEYQFGGGVRFKVTDVAALRDCDVSKYLVAGGKLIFYACNAAKQDDLIQAIANALRIPVTGFTGGVKWGLDAAGVAPKRYIKRRGMKLPLPKSVDKFPQ